jgi:hypothetical protein
VSPTALRIVSDMESLTASLAPTAWSTDAAQMRRIEWCLRIAAAACFIGHGAFGIITKQAWVPYFAVLGIGEATAYRLMPVVGTIDILSAVVALLSPRPFALLYMVIWATMTALLRPLAGEPLFETLERAGNFGVPLALLLFLGIPSTTMAWGDRVNGEFRRIERQTVARILQVTTALLLFGHGALEAFTRKPVFALHYASVGLPSAIAPVLGYLEIALAVGVLVAPAPAMLVGIALWKIATEALYPLAGAPIWEFIERAGSYGAPLALALLLRTTSLPRVTFTRNAK